MAPGLGPKMARDMPVCCLGACGILAWARPARPCGRDTRHQPCAPAAIGGSERRHPRPDILIMRSQGESLRAGEGARHVGPYQDIRVNLPGKQWFGFNQGANVARRRSQIAFEESPRDPVRSAVGDGPSTAAEHRHTAEVPMPAGRERWPNCSRTMPRSRRSASSVQT
jgi:hypothetical protein